jgi:hypothetical protein
MKNIFIRGVFILLIFFVTACDHSVSKYDSKNSSQVEPPKTIAPPKLKADIYSKNIGGAYIAALKIQSLEDVIDITELVINRGNCRYSTTSHGSPVRLNYLGWNEYYGFYNMKDGSPCNIVDIELLTNKGSISFSW